MENLKQKTVSGIMWSAIERFSLQGVQFIIQIILARLLLPSDYGMIGMLAIFLQVAQVFIDSGFTNALIQKKDRTEEDFATVFYFNILVLKHFLCLLYHRNWKWQAFFLFFFCLKYSFLFFTMFMLLCV